MNSTPKRRGFCGHYLTFQHRESGRIAHSRVDCNCWSCPHCTETGLRPELLRHCQRIAADNRKLHYLAIEATDLAWRRAYRQLKGARYFRLTANGQYHIFSAKPLGKESKSFAGLALAKLLQRIIGEITYGKSPWSACRPWSIGKRRTNHGCIILAKSKVSADSLALAADRQGIPHNHQGSRLTLRCDAPTVLGLLVLARSIQWAQVKASAAGSYPNVTNGVHKDNSPDNGRAVYTVVRAKPVLAYDTSG
jgi:hypothetical protein